MFPMIQWPKDEWEFHLLTQAQEPGEAKTFSHIFQSLKKSGILDFEVKALISNFFFWSDSIEDHGLFTHTPKLKNLHKIDPSLIPLLLLLETNTQIARHKKVESALLLLYCTAFFLPKALLGFAWLNTHTNVRGHILHYWALEKPEGGKRELEIKCVSERCRKRRWHCCCCQKSEA